MIQCIEFAKGRCGGEVCAQGEKPRCNKYSPARKYKSFGYEVTVKFMYGKEKKFHWCGLTEITARRKGMLKTLATEIVNVEPVTEEQWIRAYGVPGMRM